MPDVFISYSRKNIAFARLLIDALEKNDIQAWIDWQDIPPSADWLAEVYEAIESSDNFIFIISENSVVSEICDLEIKHAIENNKRLIPIVVNEVKPSKVPVPLSALNWIFFTEDDQFQSAVAELTDAIQVDQTWVKQHTRLHNRALEWTRRDRDAALALRGQDLNNAETWLSDAPGKEPAPTHVQTEYIFASRRETARRQRIGTFAGAGGILIAFILGIWAWSQRVEAVQTTESRATAESVAIDEANTRATAEAGAIAEEHSRATAQAILEAQYRSASAKSLSAQSSAKLGDQLDLGLLLALEANNMEDNYQTRRSLLTALTNQLHLQKFLFRDPHMIVHNLLYDPQGNVVIYDRVDKRLLVLDPATGSTLFDVPTPHEIANLHNSHLNAGQTGIRYSQDGQYMLTSAMDRSWILWDAASYQPMGDPLTDNPAWEDIISVSPSFDRLATLEEETITIWDRETAAAIVRLENLPGEIYGLPIFTSDSRYFIIPFEEQVVHVYRVDDGEIAMTFQLDTDFGNRHYLVVDSQGTRLGISGSEMALLFDLTSGEEIGQYHPNYGDSYQLFFDPDGQAYLAYDYKNTDIYIERLGDQSVIVSRFPHFKESLSIDFLYAVDPSNLRLVTSRTMMVGSELILYDPLVPHTIMETIDLGEAQEGYSIRHPVFHPSEDQILAAGNCGDSLHSSSCALGVWDLSTTPPEILYTADVDWPVRSLAFHPQGDILAVAEGYDGNISVMDWRLGKQLTKFDGTGEKPAKLAFSPNGNDLALIYNITNTPVVVWNLESEEATSIACPGSDDTKASDIAFHPHQPLLAVACGDRIIFWNAETGTVESEIGLDETLEVFEVIAFNPDGSQFATGGGDGIIRWDFQTMESLSMPSEDTTSSWGVDVLAYDPTGSMLLTGKTTNLRIFDAQSGDFIIQLDPLGKNTLAEQYRYYLLPELSVSAEGTRVVAYAHDNQLIFWQLDLEFWKASACSIANRNLTQDEWKTYMGDIPYRETCP